MEEINYFRFYTMYKGRKSLLIGILAASIFKLENQIGAKLPLYSSIYNLLQGKKVKRFLGYSSYLNESPV